VGAEEVKGGIWEFGGLRTRRSRSAAGGRGDPPNRRLLADWLAGGAAGLRLGPRRTKAERANPS
jgi:hypothetical protein